MKTPHTPAPWQLSNATSAGRFVGSGPDGVLGIAMAFGDTPDEQDANARLIAAAPDLLYALKQAFAVISQHYPSDANCCASKVETIKSAIANAEGAQ